MFLPNQSSKLPSPIETIMLRIQQYYGILISHSFGPLILQSVVLLIFFFSFPSEFGPQPADR